MPGDILTLEPDAYLTELIGAAHNAASKRLADDPHYKEWHENTLAAVDLASEDMAEACQYAIADGAASGWQRDNLTLEYVAATLSPGELLLALRKRLEIQAISRHEHLPLFLQLAIKHTSNQIDRERVAAAPRPGFDWQTHDATAEPAHEPANPYPGINHPVIAEVEDVEFAGGRIRVPRTVLRATMAAQSGQNTNQAETSLLVVTNAHQPFGSSDTDWWVVARDQSRSHSHGDIISLQAYRRRDLKQGLDKLSQAIGDARATIVTGSDRWARTIAKATKAERQITARVNVGVTSAIAKSLDRLAFQRKVAQDPLHGLEHERAQRFAAVKAPELPTRSLRRKSTAAVKPVDDGFIRDAQSAFTTSWWSTLSKRSMY